MVDDGECAVGIILELLHGCASSETAATGQLTSVIEEIRMSLVVGHTAMVGK